jgi:hypothetical protein
MPRRRFDSSPFDIASRAISGFASALGRWPAHGVPAGRPMVASLRMNVLKNPRETRRNRYSWCASSRRDRCRSPSHGHFLFVNKDAIVSRPSRSRYDASLRVNILRQVRASRGAAAVARWGVRNLGEEAPARKPGRSDRRGSDGSPGGTFGTEWAKDHECARG